MKNRLTNVVDAEELENDELEDDELEDDENEPMQVEQLFPLLLQDIVNDEDPEALAEEFFEQFVDTNRPEAAQVIGLLDLPDTTIFQLVAQMQAQTLNVVVTKAPDYLAKLRRIVAKRLAERARKS